MINTLTPAKTQGHDDQRGEVLERIHKQYGPPEEKQREATKKLGKDEFFKIMVTQIQHQDPMKPYENEQMAAQMAQFSALEQMINVNQNLEKLSQSQQPLHQLGAAGLIGKYVTADSSRVTHTEGRYSDVAFELPADADKLRIVILDDRGQNVREIEKENMKKGPVKIEWDGKNSNNFPAKSGQYLIQISAATADGKNITVQTQHTSVVHGVAYEGKETVLLTGDVRRPQKMLLKNVHKIVDPSQAAKDQATSPAAAMGQSVSAGSEGGPADPIAEMINSADRHMEGYDPGIAGKYEAIDLDAMRRANEKPVAVPPPTPEDVKRMTEKAQDLTGANPIGTAMLEGRMPSVTPGAKPSMDTINPAARQMGLSEESLASAPANSAAGQSMQSSEDGSIAGNLTE